MRRGCLLYLEDILTGTNKILKYVGNSSFEEVIEDEMRLEAIERNFTIIGEAVKNIPQEIKEKYPFVEWRKATDLETYLPMNISA